MAKYVFKDIGNSSIRISCGENREKCDYCEIKYDGSIVFGFENGNNGGEFDYTNKKIKSIMEHLKNDNLPFYDAIVENCTLSHLRIFDDSVKTPDILDSKEYSFLTNDPLLGENIILLAYGGSLAYGTNTPYSDIDVRGIAMPPVPVLLGRNNLEQYENRETDTVIYYLNKMISLLLDNNPNTIEILGCRPNEYILRSKYGEMLLENRHKFLSRRCVYSFGGYANTQLRRLQNALARDRYNQADKEKHIFGSISHAMDSILQRYHTIDGKTMNYDFSHDNGRIKHAFDEYNRSMANMEKYRNFGKSGISIYLDKSNNEDMEAELFCDVVLNHYPLRDYKNIWNEMHTIVKDYDKLGKRNTKKDDLHLNKHAMHLVRLFLMGIDILEKEEIITYRANEHDLLMSVRNGDFQREDSTYIPEFFELIDELENRFNYAAENTSLPEKPDYDYIDNLLYKINEEYVVNAYNDRMIKLHATMHNWN